jgi:GDPmannose 4,6-dehydratase
MPRAFITGITGQDGQHLAEFLHGKGYEVFGMVKGQNNPRMVQMRDEFPYVEPVPGDLADLPSLVKALEYTQPDEVYNLGAISFVALSFNQAELTANITGLGVLRMLEAIRIVGGARTTRSASTRPAAARCSARCARPRRPSARRSTRARRTAAPRCSVTTSWSTTARATTCSPAAASCSTTREPRRGLEFVTRKVTNAVARIKLGLQHEIVLGNLDSKRDWGYAGDYVKAMWAMLQQDAPDDYVVATGKTYSIEEFVRRAFAEIGIDDWQSYVRQDPKFFRPAEVDLLIGDPTKAARSSGWEPEVQFPELVDDGRQRPRRRGRQAPLRRAHPPEPAGRGVWGGVRAAGSALERHVGDGFHHRRTRGHHARASSLWRRANGEGHQRHHRRRHQPVLDSAEQFVAAQPGDQHQCGHADDPSRAPTSAWPFSAMTACASASATM